MPQVTLGAENGAASVLHYEDHGESPRVVLSTSGNYPGRDRPFFSAGTFFPISALPAGLAVIGKVLAITHELALMRMSWRPAPLRSNRVVTGRSAGDEYAANPPP